MNPDYTFVSYSRKQLYFAEALTLNLQKQGITCWFDLQQLHAGTDWGKALADGYGNCARLVLVASRASLASPYVAIEWETALKNGREVILAVFEEVEIPASLGAVPVYDFRSDFNGKLRQLVEHLNGGPARCDKIPAPNRYGLPTKLPPDLWLMLASMLLPAIWALVLSFSNWAFFEQVTQGNTLMFYLMSLLAFGLYIVFIVLPFLRRERNYERVRQTTVYGMAVMLILAYFPSVELVMGKGSFVSLLALLSFLFCLYIYLGPLNRSGALLRWFASGEVPQKMRRAQHGKLLKAGDQALQEEKQHQPVPTAYYIHHHPADAPEAGLIAQIFGKFGHKRAADPTQAQKQFMLVTNRTAKVMVEEVSAQFGEDAVYILGAPIDFCDSLSTAGNFQWIDFRDNDSKDIETLGRSLHDIRAWQREAAIEAAPTKFQEFSAPGGVQGLRYFSVISAAGAVGSGLGLLLRGDWITGPVMIILGVVLYRLVEAFLKRQVRMPVFYGMLLLTFLLPNFLRYGVQGLSQFYTIFLILGVAFPSSRFWFASQDKVTPGEVGMDGDGKIRKNARILAGIFVVLNLIFTFAFPGF